MMSQRSLGPLAVVCLLTAGAAGAADAPLLAPIFGDRVILQRDRPIELWGRANPGEQVTVTLSGATRQAQADAAGQWKVTMPDLPAGGPHTLTARTASRLQNAHDVLVGDVWLCSGQSNMEWPVRLTINSRAEIAASANENLRQITIPKASSITARGDVDKPMEWKIAGPDTTGDFSSTCYYFARELQKVVDVPLGLVVSAWGGTKIEAWMSEGAIRANGGYEPQLAVLGQYRGDESQAAARWGDIWQKWWREQGAVTGGRTPWVQVRGDESQWRRAPEELTPWESWGDPALARFDGMVWYRARVKLSAAQARQAVSLNLSQVDEVDLTWVNGRVVGSGSGGVERSYKLPANLLKAGENLVVVNALDTYAAGGMYGPKEQRALVLADGTRVPLTGWEYQKAPGGLAPPRAPWEPTAGVSNLYNGMIAPLRNLGLKGAVWYQGESNTQIPEGRAYQKLMSSLMADWRRQFDAPLPFLVVQLANYGPLAAGPVESGWALTREGQRRAVAEDGNAGLAVIYDIGNRDDVHPTNKLDVGKRLARAARHVVYGEKISASGAQPKSAKRAVDGVELTLGDFDGSLVVVGSKDPAGFELCGATQESCHFVRAQLRAGGIVKLEDAAPGSATRVRFCWADSPLCNLYDTEGLPVGPFELSIE